MTDKRTRTRRLPPPPQPYTPSSTKLGPARQRYLRRRRRHGRSNTFRALLGWFMLGGFAALIFVALGVILTPLVIRSLPPRIVARLPEALHFLQCLHPDFCREAEALPTAAAAVDTGAILIGPTSTATATYLAPPTEDPNIINPPVVTSEDDSWTVSTMAPEPTATEPPTLVPTTAPQENPASQPTPVPVDFGAVSPTATEVIVLTPTPTEAPLEVAAAAELPVSSHLHGFRRVAQTWNNCGPANLTMDLNYWGWDGNQRAAASALKPNPEDKNVTPAQMAAFVNEQLPELNAIYRYAGDVTLLKRLILAGYPILIETGFEPDGEDWMGHYRMIVGYSDLEASFYIFDSYLPTGEGGRVESYESVDKYWQHFNRVYLVVYRPEQEEHLASILGADWDEQANYEHALRVAQLEAQQDNGNPYTWFNLGTSFVLLGQYEQAAIAYDQARYIGLPWRFLWYQFGPFEAYLNTDPPRLEDVEALAQVNRHNTRYVEETYYYWGLVHMQREEYDEAARRFREALQYNRNFTPAAQALDEAQAMQ